MRGQWLLLQRILFFALAVLAVVPLWVSDYPPLQDLPQHAAAIRVLADFSVPELRFQEHFELALGQTQYLAYYGFAVVLAKVFGVVLGQRLLLSLALIATAYSVRALLRALGRDSALAFLVFPLLWNAHTVLGFVNFIAAIPLTFYGLAFAASMRLGAEGRFLGPRLSPVLFGIVSLVAFFTHVVPWAFLILGAVLFAFGPDSRGTLRRIAPLVPSLVVAVVWLLLSPAGRSVLGAAGLSDQAGAAPHFQTPLEVIKSAPDWLTNVLPGATDDWVLFAWVFLVVACVALGAGARAREETPDGRLGRSLLVRLAFLSPLALVAAFVTPSSYQWIWPINARFPLLALLFLIPILPVPRARWRGAVIALAAALGIASAVQVSVAFHAYGRDELGPLDAALDAIPPGQRVAGLIFDQRSPHVRFSPLMHSVAWYQARKGGAVMFTFADFPQSPFRFRDDARPPPVPPRWEWMPWRVRANPELLWYDYVLVRGGPGRIATAGSGFDRVFDRGRWSVWKRAGAPAGDAPEHGRAPEKEK